MTEIRKADPAARRRAIVAAAVATVLGALLIAVLERYQHPLRQWLVAEPSEAAARIRLAAGVMALVVAGPLLVFAGWLWSLGSRTRRERMFPPAGIAVRRDTPVATGDAALARGSRLRVLACALGLAAVALVVICWRIGVLLGSSYTGA